MKKVLVGLALVMSGDNKNLSPSEQPPVQNICEDSEGPPVCTADDSNYYMQIMTKTAKGIDGHDQMNPIEPGHAQIAIGIEDGSLQMSRIETYGLQPRGGKFDNFIPKNTSNDPEHFPFGSGNDVRVNHPDDSPTTDGFPFQSEPVPITQEQYGYSRYLSSNAGDFQVTNNDCVDYAVQNYNDTVGAKVFEAKEEYGISSPRKLGRDILDHNAANSDVADHQNHDAENASRGGTLWRKEMSDSGWDTRQNDLGKLPNADTQTEIQNDANSLQGRQESKSDNVSDRVLNNAASGEVGPQNSCM